MSRDLLPLTFAAVVTAGAAQAEVPSVAVDIAPVHSIVARVMEGVGEPDLIVPPGASPHGYSIRPSEAQALQDADIVFWIGPALTPWLGKSIGTLVPDAEVLELLAVSGTTELEFREGALFEANDHGDGEDRAEATAASYDEVHEDDTVDAEGHDEEEHGEAAAGAGERHEDETAEASGHHSHAAETADDHAAEIADAGAHAEHNHGALDPHAWLDPDNAKVWLDAVAAELSSTDPKNAGAYFANAADAKAEMDTLIADIEDALSPVREGNFIVFHDAYQYFEIAFDMPASGAISLSDASKPSPARVEEVHDRVADANVTCVLAEPQFNPQLVQTVLDGTDARSAVLDPLGSNLEPGAALYPNLLRNLARSLAECL